MTIAGATSPVTLAGSVVQGLAEFLGVATALQVAAPGARLIFCFGSGVLDMLRTTFSLGCVESALMAAMATEVGHYVGVPTLSPGLSTDSKHAGLQTGYEKALKVAGVCSANPDIVTGWGLIDSHNTMYLPQSVVDDEIAAMVRRLYGDVEVSDATLAAESIARVGPGGGFLGEKDTARRVRAGEHLQPGVSNRLSYDKWLEEGPHRERRGLRHGRAPAGRARRQRALPERRADRRPGRHLPGESRRHPSRAPRGERQSINARHELSGKRRGPAPARRGEHAATRHPPTTEATYMKIGYIGLGSLGRHLAGSLLRAGFTVTVNDIDPKAAHDLLEAGAAWADSPAAVARLSDTVITCLPSPEVVTAVTAGPQGIFEGLAAGGTWVDMSTNDPHELQRLAALAAEQDVSVLESPVTGGVHRAAAGMITVLVGGDEAVYQRHLPVLQAMGDRVFYIGELGRASAIKVITNMLAFIHLVADGEALMLAKRSGVDLKTAWDVIKASSGNSFVHETEGQLILNGSYNINFTMDLARKDLLLRPPDGARVRRAARARRPHRADLRAGPRPVRRRRAVAHGRQDARRRRGHRPARARVPRRAGARVTAPAGAIARKAEYRHIVHRRKTRTRLTRRPPAEGSLGTA